MYTVFDNDKNEMKIAASLNSRYNVTIDSEVIPDPTPVPDP